MRFRQQFVLALGTLVLGIGANVVSGQSASRQCVSEECACEEALEQNTVEALENFLRQYPQAAHGRSACAALAVPPGDDGVDLDSQSHDNGNTIVEPVTPAEG